MPPSPATTSATELEAIKALVGDELEAVNRCITDALRSEVALIDEVSRYIIYSGGKRLRPLIHLLSARACGYQNQHHIELAAIIEFIHTATLLHDDVVDASSLRRGQDTANARWGDEASVLVGDFLYSRAFQMMVKVSDMRVMEILADTTNIIAEGEVLQLINCGNPELSEQAYLQVIRSKTAKLFEAAARLGAILAAQPTEEEQALAKFGMHLGTAFQLVDDLLDYKGSVDSIGKNLGDDLAEGKTTLPLIYAMAHGSASQVKTVRQAIENGSRECIEEIVAIVESTEAITYTARAARAEAKHAVQALARINPSPYRDALETLTEFSVSRCY